MTETDGQRGKNTNSNTMTAVVVKYKLIQRNTNPKWERIKC